MLLLGSGMVAPPVVDYILRSSKNRLTVAGAEIDQAKALVKEHSGVDAVLLDVNNIQALEALVGRHELVISLVPATLHVLIAKVCIKLKKNMVTASYISPEMQTLDAEYGGLLVCFQRADFVPLTCCNVMCIYCVQGKGSRRSNSERGGPRSRHRSHVLHGNYHGRQEAGRAHHFVLVCLWRPPGTRGGRQSARLQVLVEPKGRAPCWHKGREVRTRVYLGRFFFSFSKTFTVRA